MAGQTKFCRQCGRQLDAEARFCNYCGYRFEEMMQSAPRPVQQTQSVAQPMQNPQPAQSQPRAVPQAQTAPAAPAVTGVLSAAAPMLSLRANAQAGELGFGDFKLGSALSGVTANAAGGATAILSPAKALLGGVTSLFGGLTGVFKNKKALIFAAVMAAAWIALGLLRGSDNTVVKFLSWLTFADGGIGRGVLGGIGGALGKGVTATALISLLSGGLGKTVRGVGAMFDRSGGRSVVTGLLGAVLGGASCLAFTGIGSASAMTSMAGISGALLSLQALGGGQGWLYSLAQSLTATKQNGVRVAQNGKLTSLLTGMTGGFAAATLLTSLLPLLQGGAG